MIWPGRRPTDPFLQRCVHESLRLHPASPVGWRLALAPIELRNGLRIEPGTLVVLDLEAANRDDTLVRPRRRAATTPTAPIPVGVSPWGHTFGGGVHACIGAELDGGVAWHDDAVESDHLYGTVAVMCEAVLAHGGRPDPDDPPQRDTTSARPHFGTYPVVFG